LAALVFEKLEEALKIYRSKLVVISDITGLFLDCNVPKIEGREIFVGMTNYLLDLASKRRIVVVAPHFPRPYLSRNIFLESVLLSRASTVIRFREFKGDFKLILEEHPNIKSSTVNFSSNGVTMDKFMET
jgi:hypothetical protein